MNKNAMKAKELVLKHLGTRWRFVVNPRLSSIWGRCCYGTRSIELSSRLVNNYHWEEVKATTLHEIAHAIAGAGHGHDAYWKKICKSIGGIPERIGYSKTIDKKLAKKWGIIRDKNREIMAVTGDDRVYKGLVAGKYSVKDLRFSSGYGNIDRDSLEFIIGENK